MRRGFRIFIRSSADGGGGVGLMEEAHSLSGNQMEREGGMSEEREKEKSRWEALKERPV